MLEEEYLQKLKQAGWSPNSLMLAMQDDDDDVPLPKSVEVASFLDDRFCNILPNDQKSPTIKAKVTSEYQQGLHSIMSDMDTLVDSFQRQSLDRALSFNDIENVNSNIMKFKLEPPSKCGATKAEPSKNNQASQPINLADVKSLHNNNQHSQLLQAANLDGVLPNGWSLFPHQKQAVIECLKLKRSIMAFDMGLGKTVISLTWAKAICTVCPECVVVVIVPCTLQEMWKKEAEMMGFHVLEKISGSRTKKSHKNMNELSISIHSWAKLPNPTEIGSQYVLIADEAHAMQSFTSQRTTAALKLCLHHLCIGTILSTGTPMRNGKPSNIFPLLLGIQHPLTKDKIAFEKRYCNAKKTPFCAWDISGATNLEELRANIGNHLLRKTKVLKVVRVLTTSIHLFTSLNILINQ